MIPKNKTLSFPLSPSDSVSYLVTMYDTFKNLDIPIYWGPNQNTEGNYIFPISWQENYVVFRIPYVGRMLFNGTSIDTDKYSQTSPPPPSPPPPGPPPPGPPPPPPPISSCSMFLESSTLLYTDSEGCQIFDTNWRIICYPGPVLGTSTFTRCATRSGPSGFPCICQGTVWNKTRGQINAAGTGGNIPGCPGFYQGPYNPATGEFGSPDSDVATYYPDSFSLGCE